MLGEVVITPTAEHERPEIQTITLDPSETNTLLAAYRQGNFLWAHRQGHRRRPPKGYPLPRNDGDAFTFRPAGDLLDERATPRLAALRRAGVAMEDELHGECSLAPTSSPRQRRDRLGIRDTEVAVPRRRNGRVRPSLTVPGGVNREPLRPCRIVAPNHVWPTSTTPFRASDQQVLAPPQKKVGDDQGRFADQPEASHFHDGHDHGDHSLSTNSPSIPGDQGYCVTRTCVSRLDESTEPEVWQRPS